MLAGLAATAAAGCAKQECKTPCPGFCVEVPDYTASDPFVAPGTSDLAAHVDPFIGTDGSGNVIPGALVPHGMVRLSPDTDGPAGSIAAYHWDDTRIDGFTHTNLEGPGGSGNGYSEILVMPGVGVLDVRDPSSAFSHDDEDAGPGYYRVMLADPGIEARLTASSHAGYHSYVFPASRDAWIVVDLGNSMGRSTGGHIEIAGDRIVRGVGHYEVHPLVSMAIGPATPTSQAKVYFHAEFSIPFTGRGTYGPEGMVEGSDEAEGDDIGAFVRLDTTGEQVVLVKVGISMVSVEQARMNAEAEIGEATFDEVRQSARDAWNEKLRRVVVDADDAMLTMFYTALYHSMFQPADYGETGGCHAEASSGLVTVRSTGGRPWYTDDWCMWDTYRTVHPLGTLIEPEIRSDVVRSMLDMYEDGGWLDKCSWHGSGYSRVMTGNPQIAVIADSWVKGLDDFDPELAWEAMLKTSNEETSQNFDGLCGYLGLGTPPEYIEAGWVGDECDPTQAASLTLEIAYADHCMAEVASLTGRTVEEEIFAQRALNYANQWNPEHGFMQSRYRDGTWVEPFDPADGSDMNGFVEATSWIFSFFVPHDVPGLIGLFGGNDAFIERLDRYFDEGHHEPDNEPGFHIPWLYNYAGRPSGSQARVRQIVEASFDDTPDGLPGNDDSGAMSAWLVLAVLGLYPVSPGDPVYQISTPLLRRATIALDPSFFEGETFTIETDGALTDVYIQSATLDGVPLDRPWVSHDEISLGGTLHLVLGPDPSTWGESY